MRRTLRAREPNRPFPYRRMQSRGQSPDTGQCRQPGQTHVSYGAEYPEIGKIIGQCPYAGIQPAELPVVRPDGQAQSSEGGEEDEGKIRTPGEMVCRSCCENGQREGQPHKEQICQDVIGGVKDGTCLYPRDGEPDEHGESQRNQGGCQKRRKADDCHAAGK